MTEPIRLAGDVLQVELDPGRPVVRGYQHLPSQTPFAAGGEGCLAVNGAPVPWAAWQIDVERRPGAVSYRTRLPDKDLTIDWRYQMDGTGLRLRAEVADDPGGHLDRLDWVDLPLLLCPKKGFEAWRAHFGPPDRAAMNKMWVSDALAHVEQMAVEPKEAAVLYGAVWDGRLCAFVDSDYPFLPLTHQRRADGTLALGLNTWQIRARDRRIPVLEATVGFLGDLNGDGRADLSDYRLWVSRDRPPGDPLYADAVTYKIFTHHASVGVATDLAQCERIVRAIHHITDGLPQVVYLVGQQEGGHDGTYPTLAGGINRLLGTAAQLRTLHAACRDQLNTVLSYHANLDDAYRRSRDWDERFVVPDASAEAESLAVQGSVCHTRDVETGAVFDRLQAFLDTFPTERTLHLDNLRLTNTVDRPGWEEIGVLEELVCGLQPIVEWLAARGITVTTEGYNGLPIDPSILVSGFWHHDPPDRMRQLLHRRVFGGGRGDHLGRYTTADYGICNGFHIDLSFGRCPPDDLPAAIRQRDFGWLPTPTLTWNLRDDWKRIVDCLYLGALLHHFYNEREMLSWEEVGPGWRVTYGGGVTAEICLQEPESLLVTMEEVTVARGGDRFIPRDGAVYAYSRDGSETTWVLPPALRGQPLRLCSLHKKGRGPAPDHDIHGDAIRLRLEAGVPVKLEAGPDRPDGSI